MVVMIGGDDEDRNLVRETSQHCPLPPIKIDHLFVCFSEGKGGSFKLFYISKENFPSFIVSIDFLTNVSGLQLAYL